MSEDEFDQDGWLARVGYHGSREPTLETLKALVSVHSSAIAYESIDVLLDRPPKLDLRSLPPRLHRRPRCPRQEPRNSVHSERKPPDSCAAANHARATP